MNKKRKLKHNLSSIIYNYCKPYVLYIIIVIFTQIVQSSLNLWLPTENGDMISYGVAKGDTHYVQMKGWIMIGVSVVQVICTILSVYFSAKTALGIGRDLRMSIFKKTEDFSLREVSKFGVPSLITRTTNDVQQVQIFFYMFLSLILTAPITIVAGITLTLTRDAKMFLILLVAMPVMCIFIGTIASITIPIFKKMQKTIDKINRVLREQLTGIRVIRAFVKDNYEHERFDGVNNKLRKLNTTTGRLFSSLMPVVMFTINMTNIFVFWFGAKQVNDGKVPIGDLTAISTYVFQILISVMIASMMVMLLPRAQVSSKRINDILRTESSISPEKVSGSKSIKGKLIELKNAEFIYSGATEPVVKNLNFTIKAGTKTAIIGSTGSGKSTVVNLIARLFDATSGEVKIDGVKMTDIKLKSLWSTIGLAPQKAYLFSGTIRSNMLFGNEKATDKQIWDALEIAQAKNFVSKLPDGLGSHVAQGGSNFSGGQKQRLSVARAIVRNPSIYLFDDSFSALDFGVDAKIRKALKKVTKDACVVVVAQRVGAIMDADQIIVMENGEVAGIGTHKELLKSCEEYQEIVYSQLSKEEAMQEFK